MIDVRRHAVIRATLLTLLLLVVGTTAAVAQTFPTAAVLGLRTIDEIDSSAADALANIVRHEILQSGRLTLIDRDRTEAVLEEQGLMMAGGCYDVSCLVEMGRVLGAERVITGSINRVGRKYLIELRAANVGTSQIEALETLEFSGRVEDLTDAMRELAQRLVNLLTRRPGVIQVTTEPQNSAVVIDDRPVGFAPVSVTRPGGVTYRVEASRSGFESASQRVALPEGDTLRVSLSLKRKLDQRKRSYYREPQARILASGGFPLEQASSSFSSDVSWGSGESYGGLIQFGSGWRLGIGAYQYQGKVRGVDEDVWEPYGAAKAPVGESMVVYSALTLALGDDGLTPFGGAGIAAMQRTVSVDLQNGNTERLTSDYEVGWMVHLGFEIPINSWLITQLTVIHARSLASDQSWWNNTAEGPDQFWVESFDNFSSYTALHFSVGVKF